MLYTLVTPELACRRPLAGTDCGAPDFEEDFAMTIEIFHLTTQIQHWLNARVAQHLAAQASRLSR
jgi:hypothetical protein